MKKPTRKPNVVEEVKYTTTDIAEKILDDARKAVTTKAEQHGDTEASFLMMADLWSTYVNHVSIIKGGIELDAGDVAQMMVMLKIARSAYGHGRDNYVDAAGYTALAAMVRPKEIDDE